MKTIAHWFISLANEITKPDGWLILGFYAFFVGAFTYLFLPGPVIVDGLSLVLIGLSIILLSLLLAIIRRLFWPKPTSKSMLTHHDCTSIMVLSAQLARLAELEAVVERLGSSEAFTLAGPISPELRARIEYARDAMKKTNNGEDNGL
jgi:hypothetical protein